MERHLDEAVCFKLKRDCNQALRAFSCNLLPRQPDDRAIVLYKHIDPL
jgi:hypothetical protein